jgi:death-on-curing protein
MSDGNERLARMAHAYESHDIVSLAACYAAGVIGNRPFTAGNERTGFMAACIFLERNGMALIVSEAEATA